MIGYTFIWTTAGPRSTKVWPSDVIGWYVLPYLANRADIERHRVNGQKCHEDSWWWKRIEEPDDLRDLNNLLVRWVHFEKQGSLP